MPTLSQLSTVASRRKTAASPNLVLLIVCAGVVLASLDLFIVNVALPQMARSFGSTGLGDLSWVLNAYAIVYASLLVLFGRLADRYPRNLGFLRRGVGFRRRIGGVRRGDEPADADRLPGRPGRRRGAAHADLARADPRHVPGRAPPERSADLDRRRRVRGRTRAGRRRNPRCGELAVGVPRERSDRRGRPDRGLAPAAGRPGASDPVARRVERDADHRGRGCAHAGARRRRNVGMGQHAHGRGARRRGRAAELVRAPDRPPPQSADRSRAVPGAGRSPARRWLPCCSRSRSAGCCCPGSCGPRTCGTGRR